MLKLQSCTAYSCSKDYERPDLNQDAWAENLLRNTFALADGATQSFSSRRWAEKLVQSFVSCRFLSIKGLRDAQHAYFHSFDTSKWTNVQWRAFQRNSYATIVGLVVVPQKEIALIQGVGDSIIIVLDNIEPIEIFPVGFDYDFNKSPFLLCSDDARNSVETGHILAEHSTKKLIRLENYGSPIFLMLTDQIAAWALQDLNDRVPRLLSIENNNDFMMLTRNVIHRSFQRRDDVTMARIVFERE